ncbi:hypothetical protein PHK61_31515 [Actinomycetospora lutea]|uniref:hypothetical protein n=1 Tax=Actinomycetospora lutea TaxID=663604 RepID=UPI00236576B6|nr:hypothetical protein [Actinomycetospora lutea]MDD7942945.1 hypothetical protein [Actinomycetospora lutea]
MPQAPTVRPAHHESAEAGDVVVGVDTHKAVHVADVVNQLGVLLGSAEFATTSSGYQQLLTWARTLARSDELGWSARLLRSRADPLSGRASGRGHRGQSAGQAGTAARQDRATTRAKAADGPVEMVRVFKLAKASATKSRTEAIN